MEHPEDSMEGGLTWPRFQSEYSKRRRGASKQEVSGAWTRYKSTSTRIDAPLTQETREREGERRPPIRSQEYTQSLTPEQAASLHYLPTPILTIIARQSRGAAGVLVQLCRRLYLVISDVVDELRESAEIGLFEVRRYLTRRLATRTTGPFLSYVAIGERYGCHHSYQLQTLKRRLEASGSRMTVSLSAMERPVPDVLAHRTWERVPLSRSVEVILERLEAYRGNAIVLFNEDTVVEVLAGRYPPGQMTGACEWYQTRMRTYLVSLQCPRLMEYMELGHRYDPERDREVTETILADREERHRVVTAVLTMSSIYQPLDGGIANTPLDTILANVLQRLRWHFGDEMNVDSDTYGSHEEYSDYDRTDDGFGYQEGGAEDQEET